MIRAGELLYPASYPTSMADSAGPRQVGTSVPRSPPGAGILPSEALLARPATLARQRAEDERNGEGRGHPAGKSEFADRASVRSDPSGSRGTHRGSGDSARLPGIHRALSQGHSDEDTRRASDPLGRIETLLPPPAYDTLPGPSRLHDHPWRRDRGKNHTNEDTDHVQRMRNGMLRQPSDTVLPPLRSTLADPEHSQRVADAMWVVDRSSGMLLTRRSAFVDKAPADKDAHTAKRLRIESPEVGHKSLSPTFRQDISPRSPAGPVRRQVL